MAQTAGFRSTVGWDAIPAPWRDVMIDAGIPVCSIPAYALMLGPPSESLNGVWLQCCHLTLH
jgi:hypothetical protein